MCLGHVYIVLKPVGSARLTFGDDLYYEFCVLMYQRKFGVPDMITDMTRSLEMVEAKINILEGYVWTSEWFRMSSGIYQSNGGGLPEPPRESMDLIGP